MLIGMHTNCRQHHAERRWPAEHFGQLADLLLVEYNHARIVFTGSADDYNYIVESVVSCIRRGRDRVIVLAGLHLLITAALLRKLTLFITVNTSMLHVAIAQDVPIVAIVGRTPPDVIIPKRANVTVFPDPALKDYNPHSKKELVPRLDEITPEQVFEKIERTL